MKQIYLTAPYTFETKTSETPEVGEGQALLKIRQIGICASDMQMYHGQHKYMTYPVVIGHEAAATVAAVGKGVEDYAVGDNVTVEPQVFCEKCYPCRMGAYNVCENLRVMGVHKDGFACEYRAVDASYLHPCLGMSDDETALVEPLAVGMGSSGRAGDLTGKSVVVVGAGTIGNLVAQSAKAKGAGCVMVTDVKEKKLAFAKKCGIDYAVNTTDKKLSDAISDVFGTRKADVIIDCAATRGSFASILEAARPESSIIITGNFKAPVEVELPVLQRQEITLFGHMMYRREDFKDAIRAVQEGRVSLSGFATQHYALSDIKRAFEFIDENPDDVMKVMLKVGED